MEIDEPRTGIESVMYLLLEIACAFGIVVLIRVFYKSM